MYLVSLPSIGFGLLIVGEKIATKMSNNQNQKALSQRKKACFASGFFRWIGEAEFDCRLRCTL